MKKYVLILISIVITNITIAHDGNKSKEATRLISGKVVDKQSGEEIAGAEIKIADKLVYTDLNGNFMTSIAAEVTVLSVSFISYNETTVTLNPHLYGEITIALESQ